MDPIFFGGYPSSMRKRVGNRLPKFSAAEAALVKGSLDFVGINHYTTYYAKSNSTNIINILLNDSLADSGAIAMRKFLIYHPTFVNQYYYQGISNIRLLTPNLFFSLCLQPSKMEKQLEIR